MLCFVGAVFTFCPLIFPWNGKNKTKHAVKVKEFHDTNPENLNDAEQKKM